MVHPHQGQSCMHVNGCGVGSFWHECFLSRSFRGSWTLFGLCSGEGTTRFLWWGHILDNRWAFLPAFLFVCNFRTVRNSQSNSRYNKLGQNKERFPCLPVDLWASGFCPFKTCHWATHELHRGDVQQANQWATDAALCNKASIVHSFCVPLWGILAKSTSRSTHWLSSCN